MSKLPADEWRAVRNWVGSTGVVETLDEKWVSLKKISRGFLSLEGFEKLVVFIWEGE